MGVMSNASVAGYGAMYESRGPRSMDGPTFACIIGRQFHNFRFGDRYWYENSGWPSSFTIEQLNEIRKVKLSTIFCDNSDDIDSMQVYAMVLPDNEINPRVPCKSGVLPRIDLNRWRDASFHSAPSQTFHSPPSKVSFHSAPPYPTFFPK